MDVFGDNWKAHENQIRDNWVSLVSEDDWVLIPGDISWASKFEEALVDLEWVDALPGHKIMIKGNHDYWWQSLSKMAGKFRTIDFLHNNFHAVGDLAICGTRGWVCPNDSDFDAHDEKIYKREGIRLRLSLDQARKAGYSRFIMMLHYPPTNEKLEPSLFTDIAGEYGVEQVVYGHLHAYGAHDYKLKGERDGVMYHLTSADYIRFSPVELTRIEVL